MALGVIFIPNSNLSRLVDGVSATMGGRALVYCDACLSFFYVVSETPTECLVLLWVGPETGSATTVWCSPP